MLRFHLEVPHETSALLNLVLRLLYRMYWNFALNKYKQNYEQKLSTYVFEPLR